MGADHADAGQPMPADLVACSTVRYHAFPSTTRQVSLRNTGVNTLWVSFDRVAWFDVAAGTSFDDRFIVRGFWYCTQLGTTLFVVNGVALNYIGLSIPVPTQAEQGE